MRSSQVLGEGGPGRQRHYLDLAEAREEVFAWRDERGYPTPPETPAPPSRKTATRDVQRRIGPNDLGPEQELCGVFDRVVVVNLDRRPDRWARFQEHIASLDWPFREPQRFRAVDGRTVKPPAWWRVGGGAWGCLQSHLRIIEQALMDELESILILEDDVFFVPDLRARFTRFHSALPDDWHQIYLGGQHLFQRRQPPQPVNEEVLRPFNVNRTHAYALHRRFLTPVYRYLTDYIDHARHPRHHVDHRLGALHETRRFNIYAPTHWLAGQSESHSNIKGKVMPSRLWNAHRVQAEHPSFVAVVGLHRSGSSCLAGVLHKLGVYMGQRLGGYEASGGYEAQGLAALCERAFPFPGVERRVEERELRDALARHIRHVHARAQQLGRLAGGKYPHLCAMGAALQAICADQLKVIHIDRPLEVSIESLRRRSRRARGRLQISDEQAEIVQRWLWAHKQRWLPGIPHLRVSYDELCASPAVQVARIIDYLGLSPTSEQRAQAVAHVRRRDSA